VGEPVGVVRVLVRVVEAIGIVAGQLTGPAYGSIGTQVRIGPVDHGTVSPEHALPLRRYIGRHGEPNWESEGRPEHGKGDAGVSAGGVKHGFAGNQQAAAARILNHGSGGAIFDAAPGLAHSALPSSVMPTRPRTGASRRTSGVEPMRSGRDRPGLAVICFVSIENCSECSRYARLEVREVAIQLYFNILADWNANMTGKSRNSNFDQTLEILRAHSFDVEPCAGVAGGVLVSKHGAGRAGTRGASSDERRVSERGWERGWRRGGVSAAAFAERPGALVNGEVARLLDRGYQKFIKTSKSELPASARQLQGIHLFSEELTQLTAESASTTSRWDDERPV